MSRKRRIAYSFRQRLIEGWSFFKRTFRKPYTCKLTLRIGTYYSNGLTAQGNISSMKIRLLSLKKESYFFWEAYRDLHMRRLLRCLENSFNIFTVDESAVLSYIMRYIHSEQKQRRATKSSSTPSRSERNPVSVQDQQPGKKNDRGGEKLF